MVYEVPMDLSEWGELRSDFKTIINGTKFILTFVLGRGTCLVPVKIIEKGLTKS